MRTSNVITLLLQTDPSMLRACCACLLLAEVKISAPGDRNWVAYLADAYLKSHSDARAHCESQGADLLTISSAADQELLRQRLRFSRFWIGLSRAGSEWRWASSGQPAVYTAWGANEPQSYQDDERASSVGLCGEFADAADTASWNAFFCDELQPYVCQLGEYPARAIECTKSLATLETPEKLDCMMFDTCCSLPYGLFTCVHSPSPNHRGRGSAFSKRPCVSLAHNLLAGCSTIRLPAVQNSTWLQACDGLPWGKQCTASCAAGFIPDPVVGAPRVACKQGQSWAADTLTGECVPGELCFCTVWTHLTFVPRAKLSISTAWWPRPVA